MFIGSCTTADFAMSYCMLPRVLQGKRAIVQWLAKASCAKYAHESTENPLRGFSEALLDAFVICVYLCTFSRLRKYLINKVLYNIIFYFGAYNGPL